MLQTLSQIGLRHFEGQPERFVRVTPRGDLYCVEIRDNYGRYLLDVPFEDVWPGSTFLSTLTDMLRHRRSWNATRESVCDLLYRLRLRLTDPAQKRRTPRDPFDEFDDETLAGCIRKRLEFLEPALDDDASIFHRNDSAASLSRIEALIARWSLPDTPTA